MKFMVSRTSSIWDDTLDNSCRKPCDEAVREAEEEWFIEIPNLEALLEFIRKYGRVVIMRTIVNPDIFEIEIYDTCRE